MKVYDVFKDEYIDEEDMEISAPPERYRKIDETTLINNASKWIAELLAKPNEDRTASEVVGGCKMTVEEKQKTKPLKDWTLGEIHDYCKRDTTHCDACDVQHFCDVYFCREDVYYNHTDCMPCGWVFPKYEKEKQNDRSGQAIDGSDDE